MQKYNVMGHEMIKVRDIRHVIRMLRKRISVNYGGFDKEKQAVVRLAYDDIVKQIYREELDEAKTPNEIRHIIEMPGDFVVCKHGEGKHDIFYFCGWGNPDILTMSDMPIVSRKLTQVMWFEYESKAQEVADVLGDGWHVIDATLEEDSGSNRILNTIFGEDDDYEMKQGQD